MDDGHIRTTIRVSDEAAKAFDILKEMGYERSLSAFVERMIKSEYASRIRPKSDKMLYNGAKFTQESSITNPECNTQFSMENDTIRQIVYDYADRSKRFSSRNDYENLQKNWLRPRLKDLSGFNGIRDIENAFEVMEEIKESVSI